MTVCLSLLSVTDFYPRPPRGGRLEYCFAISIFFEFLSTPSARRATSEPLLPYHCVGSISIHALREEGDQGGASTPSGAQDFYPRPPRGGRLLGQFLQHRHQGLFLSTPSARRATSTSISVAFAFFRFLSTPSARRATFKRRQDVKLTIFLSTPSARRATYIEDSWHWVLQNFYPRPPRGGRLFEKSRSFEKI